jgi:hypothetical protein
MAMPTVGLRYSIKNNLGHKKLNNQPSSLHFSYVSFLKLLSYAFSTVSQSESRSVRAVRRAVSEDSLSAFGGPGVNQGTGKWKGREGTYRTSGSGFVCGFLKGVGR